jgi:hypothetical protein
MSSNRFSVLRDQPGGSASDANSRRSSIVSDSHTRDEAVEKTAAFKLNKSTSEGEALDVPLRVVVSGTGTGFRKGTAVFTSQHLTRRHLGQPKPPASLKKFLGEIKNYGATLTTGDAKRDAKQGLLRTSKAVIVNGEAQPISAKRDDEWNLSILRTMVRGVRDGCVSIQLSIITPAKAAAATGETPARPSTGADIAPAGTGGNTASPPSADPDPGAAAQKPRIESSSRKAAQTGHSKLWNAQPDIRVHFALTALDGLVQSLTRAIEPGGAPVDPAAALALVNIAKAVLSSPPHTTGAASPQAPPAEAIDSTTAAPATHDASSLATGQPSTHPAAMQQNSVHAGPGGTVNIHNAAGGLLNLGHMGDTTHSTVPNPSNRRARSTAAGTAHGNRPPAGDGARTGKARHGNGRKGKGTAGAGGPAGRADGDRQDASHEDGSPTTTSGSHTAPAGRRPQSGPVASRMARVATR